MASLPPKPPAPSPPPLAPGWTEHKAPTGHAYYYNATTKTSTYTRPVARPPPPTPASLPPAPHFSPAPHPQQPFNPAARSSLPSQKSLAQNLPHRPYFHDPYGVSGLPGWAPQQQQQQQHRPPPVQKPLDRPKKKRAIPGAEPWVLVITRAGRQFVHNLETKISLWAAPKEVQEKIEAMPEPDLEAERAVRRERRRKRAQEAIAAAEARNREERGLPKGKLGPPATTMTPAVEAKSRMPEHEGEVGGEEEGEGDEEEDNEEDNEDEDEDQDGPDPKRAKTDGQPSGPVEFTEDDIAWQLEAIANQYDLHEDLADDGGEEFTHEECAKYFMDMLDSYSINPYTTWDLALPTFIDDTRYTMLSTTKARKEVFTEWCRLRIATLRAEKERAAKIDPRIPFWVFLKQHFSPKLYWPEFKRKHRKDPEMKDTKLLDKDRERMFRDYASRIKASEPVREGDFKRLLRSVTALTRRTPLGELPDAVVADVRYVVCPESTRTRIVREHLESLPEVPITEEERQRDRQEAAIRDREVQVQMESRARRREEESAKRFLREEEAAVERAKRVSKRGLLGHIKKEETAEEGEGVGE